MGGTLPRVNVECNLGYLDLVYLAHRLSRPPAMCMCACVKGMAIDLQCMAITERGTFAGLEVLEMTDQIFL